MTDPTIDDLRRRITDLEKENRRWKVASVSCVTLLVIAGVFTQVHLSQSLHAEREAADRAAQQAQDALQREREMRDCLQNEAVAARQRAEEAREQAHQAMQKAEAELARLKK